MSTTRMSGSSRRSSSQPVVTRGSRSSSIPSLLLKEVVLADVSFGELFSLLGIILAQATLDYLVLKVVFYVLDPTPRSPPEVLHELVAIQRALELLDGVLGPYLVHAALQATPGFLGHASPTGGAAGDVRPGEF